MRQTIMLIGILFILSIILVGCVKTSNTADNTADGTGSESTSSKNDAAGADTGENIQDNTAGSGDSAGSMEDTGSELSIYDEYSSTDIIDASLSDLELVENS